MANSLPLYVIIKNQTKEERNKPELQIPLYIELPIPVISKEKLDEEEKVSGEINFEVDFDIL